ncbi:MAG: metal ABC transporter ATP-binding protein [Bacteroidales bacterium]|nr:metal ABC transporter ATP-binding protein [Bacteroidales bacterium]MBP3670886.1 metal ABC transporter ATP-binding protein [Bacteroidaceae bacterium]
MPLPSNNIIVRLQDVSLSYGHTPVLQGVNLEIDARDFVVVTGANGGGKTSLLRVMLKLIAPTSGQVMYLDNGVEIDNLHIGYLPQKNAIDNRFPISVEEVVASGLYAVDKPMSKVERMQQVRHTLQQLELEQLSHRHIGELSGGQLQRALLARAIISRPRLLVLDEPLSYIDEVFAPRIYDILSQLSAHTAVVMVTHRPALVTRLATQNIKVVGCGIDCAL